MHQPKETIHSLPDAMHAKGCSCLLLNKAGRPGSSKAGPGLGLPGLGPAANKLSNALPRQPGRLPTASGSSFPDCFTVNLTVFPPCIDSCIVANVGHLLCSLAVAKVVVDLLRHQEVVAGVVEPSQRPWDDMVD